MSQGTPPGGPPGGYGQPPPGAPPPGGYGSPPQGAPPGGYGQGYGALPQPGYGGYPMVPAQPPSYAPGHVMERSAVVVLLLSLFTCGIYSLYWIYKTCDELQRATGDPNIKPGLDTLLSFVTCGIWGAYVYYRNAQKVFQIMVARSPGYQDQSQTILILAVVGYFVGITTLVALYFTQEQYNALAKAG